ncbi:hypothetical protein EDD15DRAFT_2379435 [Pisolithus albus]|nr:hypothetical protein EDD15DRAFT_2379435 [Pisolithus albus]
MAQNVLPSTGSPPLSRSIDVPNIEDTVEEQIGGGRRPPSPPPQLTPTRFRTHIRATVRDSGLVREAQARRERLLNPPQSDGALNNNEDIFGVKSTPPSAPCTNTDVQCASLLFCEAQDTSNNSPFPSHETKSDGVPASKAQIVSQCTIPTRFNVASCTPSYSEKEKGEKKMVEAQPSKSDSTMNNEHENTAATEEDGRPPSAGGSRSGPLKNTAPASFSRISFQDKPDSVHFESALPLPDVAPVPQADGSRESDEDTPRQKDVSSGSLNVWPDGTISFGDSAHAEFDFDADFDRSETPSPSNQRGSVQSGSMLVDEGNTKGQSTAADEPTFVVGRTPASVAALLEEGFDHINDEFNTLSGRVRMPIQQVIQRFTQQYARSNSANEWNTYQQYFAANKARELQRLQGGDDVAGTPSEKMSKCYKLFCEQFPDTYKQILAVYKDTVILGNADKTVAQRQQLFHNTSKRLVQLFNSVAKCHAFEGAFLLAGSVVNQDGGLGYMHTTPNAENFFLERCRADEDEMVGHFKAHIYSRSSLAIVAEAFDSGKQYQGPSATKDDGNKRSQGASQTDVDDREPSELVDKSRKRFHGSPSSKDGENCAVEQSTVDSEERGDHGRLRTLLVQALIERGCNWASGRLFPWKNLPKNLARSSVVCYNFPDNVLFPGEERHPHPKSGSKGISDLTLAECGILIAALTDKSKNGLHFVVKPDAHDALYYSRSPVIYGAPPDSDSKHAFAKRMYANLKCDRNGAARKSSASATRLKKKKTGKSTRDVEVISIPDSDEIMPNAVPHTKVKRPAPSADDSDEIEEIPPVVRKSTRLQPRVVIVRPAASKKRTRQVVESDENDDDSVDVGDSEYNPDDKASGDEGSNPEEARVADEGDMLEDERQSSSRKRKRTFDDTGRASKRLAINPKPVKRPSINPASLSYKGKGKSSSIVADVAVENEDDTLENERHTSHESGTTFDDTERTSKRPAISPMLIESPPICPAALSSRDKGNSQNVIDDKTTDVSPRAESGLDASEANQGSHAISSAVLPSPDEDGHVGIPKKIQTPVLSVQHWSSDLPRSPRTPPANYPLREPAKDSPPITHPSDESQVPPPPARLYSPFPYQPPPAPPFNEASQSSKEPCTSTVAGRRPKPRPVTRDGYVPAQDSKNAFNLRHRMRRPGGNVAPMVLSASSTDLLAAEEGRVCEEASRVETGGAGRMEMEDARLGAEKGVMDSMRDMAREPTGKEAITSRGTFHRANCTAPHEGFPPSRYAYDYHPMHRPPIRYERDPYAAEYRAARGFPDHSSGFVHDPWEDGHADYEGQLQYMRGGSRYGPQDPNNQFSAYQGPYPPPRAYPNDAIPGYYYYGTRAQPHAHFRQSPVLRNGPLPDFTSGTAPGPPQQRNHLPPAQSTTPQSKDKSEVNPS